MIRGKKYYIIWCNYYYEATLKKVTDLTSDKEYTFKTRLGDLHLRYSPSKKKWDWSPAQIYENRFDAILEIGLRIYKGQTTRRIPFTEAKHFRISLKHIPEKMI